MRSFISYHKDFLLSVLSVFSGAVIGFTAAHFIQQKVNDYVLETCELNKVVALKELPTIKSYYCIK